MAMLALEMKQSVCSIKERACALCRRACDGGDAANGGPLWPRVGSRQRLEELAPMTTSPPLEHVLHHTNLCAVTACYTYGPDDDQPPVAPEHMLYICHHPHSQRRAVARWFAAFPYVPSLAQRALCTCCAVQVCDASLLESVLPSCSESVLLSCSNSPSWSGRSRCRVSIVTVLPTSECPACRHYLLN